MASNLNKNIATCLDPNKSVIVKACAGSGKTWLLSSRIIRIIIENPNLKLNSILAITFTENAAYEIQERIKKRLHEIAFAKDNYDELLKEIGLSANKYPQPDLQILYKKFILARPNISVNTFHGWFNQIISFLPWSIRLSLFNKIEPNTERLKDIAWQNTLVEITNDPKHQNSLRELLGFHRLRELQKLFNQVIEHRLDWYMHFGHSPEDDKAFSAFMAKIEQNIPLQENALSMQDFVNSSEIDDALEDISNQLARSLSKTCLKISQQLDDMPDNLNTNDRFDYIKNVFYTKSGEVRKIVIQLMTTNPSIADSLEEITTSIEKTIEYEKGLHARKYNELCAAISLVYAKAYHNLKQFQGVIDYSDMELIPIRALREGSTTAKGNYDFSQSPALLDLFYKMDATYQHILIDEFQDSNPAQWAMLQAWLDASAGSENQPKVFIVGDPKQSIYSFRHGDPRLLNAAQKYLENPHYQGTLVEFNTTRRCSQSVIDVVNEVFLENKIDSYEKHDTLSKSKGTVHLIKAQPFVKQTDDKEEVTRIRNPLTTALTEEDADVFATDEANSIANYLDQIINKLDLIAADGSRSKCSIDDVMILHPTRIGINGLVEKLTERGYPCVAQSTESRLKDLECQDIMALMQTIYDPYYGLALVHVLRSPIFNLSEEEIWAIYEKGTAAHTKDCNWLDGFLNVDGSEQLHKARELILRWRNLFATERYSANELLATVYADTDLVNKYVTAVPIQIKKRVALNLEWILNYTLEVDSGNFMSLTAYVRFLQEMETSNEDLSADTEMAGVIKIMSIHKAKGLESPVVIVINSNHQNRYPSASLLVQWNIDNIINGPSHISFNRTKKVATLEQMQVISDKEYIRKQEDLNMLYVALTRAKNNLIVSIRQCRKTPPILWGGEVEKCLEKLGAENQNGFLTYDGNLIVGAGKEAIKKVPTTEPPWELFKHKSVTTDSEQTREMNMAANQGLLFHNLIALLIKGVTDADLQKYFLTINEQELRDLKNDVNKVLDPKTEFAKLLHAAKTVECELPIIDEEGNRLRIDCYIDTGDELWVLDYKTGENVSLYEYFHQLQTYVDVVSVNEPKKKINAALVDSDGSLTMLAQD